MPTHGVEIVVEDDDTDTTFQYKKLVKKMTKGYLKSLQEGKIHFLKDTKTTIGRDSAKDICLNVSILSYFYMCDLMKCVFYWLVLIFLLSKGGWGTITLISTKVSHDLKTFLY